MKKVSAIFFALVISVSLFLATSVPASAAVTTSICPSNPAVASGVINFNPLCDLILDGDSNILGNVLNVVFIVAVILALAFLIFGGIKWITSGGDKAKVEAARNTLVAALVGLVLVFLSYFILRIVFGLFGLEFEDGNIWAALSVF